MDTQILRIAGQVAGIGGLALGVLMLVFREVIRLKVFPQLAKAHAYKIIRLILLLVWSVALAGIGAWVWVETSRSRQSQSASLDEAEANLRARVEELERGVPSFKEEWKKEVWIRAEATSDAREICVYMVKYPGDPLALLAAFRITKLATSTVVKALESAGSSKSLATMTSEEIYQTVLNLCEQAPFSLEQVAGESLQNQVAAAHRAGQAVELSAPSYRVAVKYGLVTDHRACGDSSGAKYAGMEPQWALKVNGDLVSSYVAPQRANFKTGGRIPASGSLIWTPQSESEYLRFDGDVCDLDGDPPRCQLKGSIQESIGILNGKVKLADGTEPKLDDEGYLVLDAVFESDCGFSIHVEIVPLA